jgi:hypothetical protein
LKACFLMVCSPFFLDRVCFQEECLPRNGRTRWSCREGERDEDDETEITGPAVWHIRPESRLIRLGVCAIRPGLCRIQSARRNTQTSVWFIRLQVWVFPTTVWMKQTERRMHPAAE